MGIKVQAFDFRGEKGVTSKTSRQATVFRRELEQLCVQRKRTLSQEQSHPRRAIASGYATLHFMGLIQDFTKEPETFLKKFAVIVGDETEWDGSKPPGVAKFYMQAKKTNVVHLVRKLITGPKASECVDAYWLPWKTKTGVVLDLAEAADWLFTSQMTNCRFTILTENDKAVKVAHLAGTLNSSKLRTDWEENPANKFISSPTTQRARRFSASGNDLLYAGNKGDQSEKSSSAFVFGHKEKGEWKFYTQVNQGFRTVNNTIALTDDIKILTTMASI